MIDVWMMLDELRELACEPPLDTPEVEPRPPPDTRSGRERQLARWSIERAAIVARYRAGETASEIARDIGVTSQAVRVRLRREGVGLRHRTA